MKWNRIKEHGKTIGASVLVLILIWIAAGFGTFEKPADNAAIARSPKAVPIPAPLIVLLFSKTESWLKLDNGISFLFAVGCKALNFGAE